MLIRTPSPYINVGPARRSKASEHRMQLYTIYVRCLFVCVFERGPGHPLENLSHHADKARRVSSVVEVGGKMFAVRCGFFAECALNECVVNRYASLSMSMEKVSLSVPII